MIFLFQLRTIKAKVLTETTHDSQPSFDMYGQATQYDNRTGHKRKVYFLLLVSGLQPVLSFWLSYHLMPRQI